MDRVTTKETLRIAKGVALLATCSCLLLLLLGSMNWEVFFGLLLGSVYSIANFYMIGLSVEEALDREERSAQMYMAGQYFFRFFLTACVILIGIVVDFINPFGVMVALFFPKVVLFYQTITERRRVD